MSAENRHRANAIRALSMDAVHQANSGHPGMPLGMADIAEALWYQVLNHNPNNPAWPNRDRFVLSNGHGSMLLYSLLHLSGYDLSMDDLKQFRQLHSKTPGHPESFMTPGVETTTGPLGQGLANAVGMAIAEQMLAAQFNVSDHNIIDHYSYAFCGDGCLMEGISHEACSLAGTLGLGKLIVFYDDNGISIDGQVDGWFTDDTAKRFDAYHWQVIENVDGHNSDAILNAINKAQEDKDRPTLIMCKTTIGFGSPNLAGSEKSHGSPFSIDEIKATKKALNWSHDPFDIPSELKTQWDSRQAGQALEDRWQAQFASYQQAHPKLAAELQRRLAGELTSTFTNDYQAFIKTLANNNEKVASRKASEICLNQLGPMLGELVGGSADLAGSNNTRWSNSIAIDKNNFSGNYINYGVREFAMSAIMNGLSLHGGFIPYGGTFLVFADYAKNAIRLAAMNEKKAIFVLTHDSIGLGEDGPTHQPIEQAAMLRLTPKLHVWRPCDLVETAVSWQQAVEYQGASCLLLSRQGLPAQSYDDRTLENIKRGGYVLSDSDKTPEIILIATGSEVSLAIEAKNTLQAQGKQVRVVSMPCTNVFDKQSSEYKQSVLPKDVVKRIAIEALHKDTWYKYIGLEGHVFGMDSFGYSAPAADIFNALNLTAKAIVDVANTL